MGAVLVAISLGGKLLGVLPMAIDAAVKIRQLLQGSGDFTVDIQRFQGDATAANAETLRLIKEWEASHPV